ncbi:MAG: IS200/IS605 family transposase [Planctomycetota bacterium]|nr:MAG: IS200/IS605 family transposase [Planctomycetota bacterium]REJ90219.1 MAG: IS200/IS605 family transposase [Planctomycetota bacterium]REK28158.1 MAG: IS200/IS605 family transposase [Planctomycetota bacterium]REK36048.1 MAG: IS200/IS605 family transposase [Planctomycetota bacterium]
MPQSLAQIYLHIIFSTKERRPFLQDETLRSALHGYLAGACSNLECPAIEVGGIEDHVHILCRYGRTLTIADLLRELKKESSKCVKERSSDLQSFSWQTGYGAFSVSPSHVGPLRMYIATQEDHHRRESFQDEFRRLLRKYGVEFDERYVWD